MGSCVAILMVSRIADLKIYQFWMEKWTEVPSPFFLITQVRLMKKMKTDKTKNKIFKPQWGVRYLTLTFIIILLSLPFCSSSSSPKPTLLLKTNFSKMQSCTVHELLLLLLLLLLCYSLIPYFYPNRFAWTHWISKY
jgi:di/tricarboxylate transporter